eukprot:5986356-Amphidinium_carterae.3
MGVERIIDNPLWFRIAPYSSSIAPMRSLEAARTTFATWWSNFYHITIAMHLSTGCLSNIFHNLSSCGSKSCPNLSESGANEGVP